MCKLQHVITARICKSKHGPPWASLICNYALKTFSLLLLSMQSSNYFCVGAQFNGVVTSLGICKLDFFQFVALQTLPSKTIMQLNA